MAKIYKYQIEPGGVVEISMPKNAQVLTAQMQHGEAYIWAKVDPTQPNEKRKFYAYGTGHEMPDDPRLIHVATFQMYGGDLVWHVFDATFAAGAEGVRLMG